MNRDSADRTRDVVETANGVKYRLTASIWTRDIRVVLPAAREQMEAPMHVSVDLEKCQGYANCITDAPEVFDVSDETDKVILLQENPDDSLLQKVMEASLNCPVQAILVERA
jgi:ferredoxin